MRLEVIAAFYEDMCPEEISDIFITDFIAGEEGRKFESAWFFSAGYMMEAKTFVSQDIFDLVPTTPIVRWEVTKSDYDFVTATEASRISLHFVGPHINGTLRATRENCDFLRDLMLKYVVPNVRSPD
jgi:hypothetical protein